VVIIIVKVILQSVKGIGVKKPFWGNTKSFQSFVQLFMFAGRWLKIFIL